MKKSSSLLLCVAVLTVVVPHRLFGQPRAPESPAAGPGQFLSPRHDFYQYANSEAFKNSWGRTSTQSNADVINKLKQLSEAAAVKSTAKGSDEQLIGDLWFTGMDVETLNREGIAPLQPYLDRIDKINTTQEMMDVVGDLNMDTRRDSFLFDWIVWRDDDNSKRLVLRLSPGGTTGPGLFPVTNPNAERFRAAFRTYLQKTFVRLHSDENKARSSAEAVIELEAQMARAFATPNAFTAVTLSELSGIAPSIDWRRYFKKIGLRNTDAVVMQGQAYFRNLGELIRTIPLSTWKDYLRIRLLGVNVAFLDDRTLDEFFQYDRVYTGAEKPRDRWQRVVRHLEARLGPPMTRQFFKVHDLGPVKAYYQRIAESFRAVFRERIEKVDWMTDSTKAQALKKLDSMLLTVGYQNGSLADLRTMDIRRDVYVRNIMRANRWLNQREIARVGTIVDRSDPGLSGMPRGDAAYNNQNNEAILPVNDLLHGQETDHAVVYAKLRGLGHEMSHGFDNNGRHHDATGNKANWWTEADVAAFDQRTKVLVELYNEFIPVEGVRVNGQRTLAENLSDLTGLLIALDAYKRTEHFKKNELVNGFTPLQRFFLAFAIRDRGGRLQNAQEIADFLRGGVHSPDKERVNGTMMNVPEFYEAFNVKPGDPMYRPEEKRARIW